MKSKEYKVSAIVFYTVIIALALGLPNMSFAGTIQLPKTGQTKCYDIAGNQITCAGTGQDGDMQAGVVWPNPRFTPNADTTITDNLTGLVWVPDGNVMHTRDSGFDIDATTGDGMVTWYHALDYVAKLNNENYIGHADWRLPNVNELDSLINDNEPNSASWLNSQEFINVRANGYWSSTTNAGTPVHAYHIGVSDGSVVAGGNKSVHYGVGFYQWPTYLYVWPVRDGQCGGVDDSVTCLPKSGQTTGYYDLDDGVLQKGVVWPNPRFTDHSNGTVTDNLSGLMWTQNANLPDGSMNWQQALDYVKTISTGGYTDWRLPNKEELRSICDYSQYNPALPPVHPFTNVLSDIYWSSTTYTSSPGYAWVGYMDGGAECYDKSSNNVHVWPVRTVESIQTLIKLSSFAARPRTSEVILQWSTESEIDNAGFNLYLYRSESENGQYTKINTSIIPAKGSSTQGASYEFIDNNVQNRKTYYYKLEDIDLNGMSTMHGPVSAMPRLIYGMKK